MAQTAKNNHGPPALRTGAAPPGPAAAPRARGGAGSGGRVLGGSPQADALRPPLDPPAAGSPGPDGGPEPAPAALPMAALEVRAGASDPRLEAKAHPAASNRAVPNRTVPHSTARDRAAGDRTARVEAGAAEFDAALWRRLLDFRIDGPGVELPFLARLAREQAGWSLADARAAWFEYLRFLYLACRAGHPVTPSNEVDAVWHLHLVYTQSYWQELCPRVLGLTLHHGPTRGGSAQARRYLAQYRQTLEAYRRVFRAEPPARFWPPPAERFGQRFVSVDRRRVLLVPRSLAAWSLVLAAAAALAVAFLGQRWT